jgi:hypothetical protein
VVQLRVQNSQGAFAETSQTITLTVSDRLFAIKVLLQGNYNDGTQLLEQPPYTLPSTNPFNDPTLDNPAATVVPAVFAQTGSEAIVDWVTVRVEDDTTIITKAALLRRDGNVVDVDGQSSLDFSSLSSGTYEVTVRQRNHLSVTSTWITLN